MVQDGTTILSHALASSADLHTKTGGIVPEVSARMQAEAIIPILQEVLGNDTTTVNLIDAIAVTVGPGLIGSLVVGVETAKALAWAWDKPIVPVDHVLAHLYGAWFNEKLPELPALGLVVSGGHTEFILIKDHGEFEFLGGTRDDAAGEAFDKVARLLDLPYPGGPAIEKLAAQGNPRGFNLPRPMLNEETLEMSFSGLKTAVRYVAQDETFTLDQKTDLAASFQQAVIDVLVEKTKIAVKRYQPQSVILAGGVAANTPLRSTMEQTFAEQIEFLTTPIRLAVDNAAIVASYAYFNHQPQSIKDIVSDPNYHAKSIGSSKK